MNNQQLAQGIRNPVIPPIIGGPSTGGIALGELISNLVGFLFIVAFVIAFMYLLMGGVYWITSGGDKANLESARNRIIHSLVGLVVVGSAWAIASLAAQFFCLDLTHLPIPSIGTEITTVCK